MLKKSDMNKIRECPINIIEERDDEQIRKVMFKLTHSDKSELLQNDSSKGSEIGRGQ